MPAKKLTKPTQKPKQQKPNTLKKPQQKRLAKTKPKSILSPFRQFDPKRIEDVKTRFTTDIVMMIGEDKKGTSRPIKIVNNVDAKNPNLRELNEFLRTSEVRAIASRKVKKGEYECADYSRDLHNLAEKEGIRCGFVIVYYTHGIGHALNVFETRDEGLIFIDFAMLARYDTERFVGKETEKVGKDFYQIKGRKHFETVSGRLMNIAEISITW